MFIIHSGRVAAFHSDWAFLICVVWDHEHLLLKLSRNIYLVKIRSLRLICVEYHLLVSTSISRCIGHVAILARVQVNYLPSVLGRLRSVALVDWVASNVRIIIIAVEADSILSKAECHIHIILIVLARANWWLTWPGISSTTRVTWTLTWGSISSRCSSGWEEVSFSSLFIILSLVHSDLHVIWFLNWLSQVNYQVVADLVFIRRNTLFYATGFVDHVIFLAVDPSCTSDWSLHQIRLRIIILLRSCIKGGCTTCWRLFGSSMVIFGGGLNWDRVSLVHRI